MLSNSRQQETNAEDGSLDFAIKLVDKWMSDESGYDEETYPQIEAALNNGLDYEWLQSFDADEKKVFFREIGQAYCSGDPAGISAVIHEWRESALAIANPEITAAFSGFKK